MKRRLLNLLAALSLALCVATVALWVRSYWVSDWVGRVNFSPGVPTEDHHVYLRIIRGTAAVVGGGDPARNFSHARWVRRRSEPYGYPLGPDAPPWLRAAGIGWENERVLETGETTWGAQVHLAYLASLSGLAALLLALRGRTAGHKGNGHCRACGYDLRATPEQCPECGTVTGRLNGE